MLLLEKGVLNIFITISQYNNLNNSSFESLLPISVTPEQDKLIEIASFKERSTSSEYEYLPLLRNIVHYLNHTFPAYGFLETYSDQLFKDFLIENSLSYSVIKETSITTFFKISLLSMSDLELFYSLWATSGIDSLFNAVTFKQENIELSEKGAIKVILSDKVTSPVLCFSHDLQGLVILGAGDWKNTKYIKNTILQGIEILEEINVTN